MSEPDQAQAGEFEQIAADVEPAAKSAGVRVERGLREISLVKESSAAAPGFAAWHVVLVRGGWSGERAAWEAVETIHEGSTETQEKSNERSLGVFATPAEMLAVVCRHFGIRGVRGTLAVPLHAADVEDFDRMAAALEPLARARDLVVTRSPGRLSVEHVYSAVSPDIGVWSITRWIAAHEGARNAWIVTSELETGNTHEGATTSRTEEGAFDAPWAAIARVRERFDLGTM